MKSKEDFIIEVGKRLNRIFSASKEGYKSASEERHRLEGFMNAGIFIGLSSNAELAELMNDNHVQVFGKTIQQRKTELASNWREEVIDYGQYEQPTYERTDR